MARTSVPADKYVSLGDVTLHYLDWGGEKPPLLLLAGLHGTGFAFLGIADRLADHYRVLSLTRRGNGKSDKPEEGYDINVLVKDIVGFLDAVKIESAHIAGFSFGGIEATSLAIEYPNRVRSIIYLDSAYDYSSLQAADAEKADPLKDYYPKSPCEEDFASFDRYVSYVKRTEPDLESLWDEALEREILEEVQILPDGRVQIVMTDKTLAQLGATLQSYSPDYSKIRAPTLAIYSIFDYYPLKPVGIPPELVNKADEYWRDVVLPAIRSGIEPFRNGVPDAEILELANTHHACFRHREDDVYHAIVTFLATR